MIRSLAFLACIGVAVVLTGCSHQGSGTTLKVHCSPPPLVKATPVVPGKVTLVPPGKRWVAGFWSGYAVGYKIAYRDGYRDGYYAAICPGRESA